MPWQPYFVRRLREGEFEELVDLIKSSDDEEFVLKLKAVLLSTAGTHLSDIADQLGANIHNLRRWLKAFDSKGIDGLRKRKPTGRPGRAEVTLDQIQSMLVAVSLSPRDLDLPYDVWSEDRLWSYVQRSLGMQVTLPELRRLLRQNDVDTSAWNKRQPRYGGWRSWLSIF